MTTSTQPSLSESSVCPGCGAGLVYSPSLGKLACPYCNSAKTVIGNAEAVVENPLQKAQWQNPQTSPLTAKAIQVECGGCKAQITFEPPDVAGDCPFCGTHITAQPQSADPIITPGGILPFKIGRKEGRNRLTTWLSTRWFAPSSLKQLAQHEALTGVYLPFWTFDAKTRTRYTGERGTYYYVTKTRQVKNSDGEWETEEYQERHTSWSPASGTVSRAFDDVLIPAVRSVDLKHLRQIGPWPLKQLAAYDSSFLRGFQAQRYQVSLPQGYSQAKTEMSHGIDSSIRADIGGDDQRIHSRSTTYSDETFKHILLPVWMATYRFKNKPYQVMINGESGKVVGDRPYCPFKIAGAITGAIVALGTIFAGYSYIEGEWRFPTWLTNPSELLPQMPDRPADETEPTSQPTPAPGAEATPSTATPPATPSAPAPSPAFAEGLDLAYEAATKTQAARSKAEWQSVSNLWEQAIVTLQKVPADDPNAAIARQKVQDYQRNLNYAREQLAKAP
jgi:ribosomal protein S27E